VSSKTRIRMPNTPFLDAVRKSGLLTPDDLIGVLSRYEPEEIEATDPIHLATYLVRKKLLTKFQAMQLLNGRTGGFLLGRYKVLEGLRQDRVGMVFLAEHMDTGQKAFVKVLPSDRASDVEAFAAFMDEVKVASRINLSAAARILETGVLNGTHYVVTEHVAAPTMDKVLEKNGPVSPGVAALIAAQVALALQHAHAAGLLHRDIKPQNIALFPDRRVKLIDLGLTNFIDDPFKSKTKRINLKEYADEVAHIPPEQAWGAELDARSDLYSLGSTLYALLTGGPAFAGFAPQAMQARQTQDIPAPSDIRPDIPEPLDNLIQKLGKRDPEERFQKASEVIATVYPWLPPAEWEALGVPQPRPTMKRPVIKAPSKPTIEDEDEKPAKSGGMFGWVKRLFGG
jgi:serine/threonine protein kinase